MNKALETRFSEARSLSDADQERLSDVIGQCIAHLQHAADEEQALSDAAYRTHVEEALDEAEGQRAAGQFMPMREAMADVKAKFKEDYDL